MNDITNVTNMQTAINMLLNDNVHRTTSQPTGDPLIDTASIFFVIFIGLCYWGVFKLIDKIAVK